MQSIEPLQPLNPRFMGGRENANYSEYFMVRLKEYLMNLRTQSKLLFVLKILLVLSWDKSYGLVYGFLKKIYLFRIKKYIPKMSLYKTQFKKIELACPGCLIPRVAGKYASDKMTVLSDFYNVIENDQVLDLDENGIEFEHEQVVYLCYQEKGAPDYPSTNKYIMECSSNLPQNEAIGRTKKMFAELATNDIFIYDYNQGKNQNFNTIKINRNLNNIFLQEDVEKQIKNFISRYDSLQAEYQNLGITFKNNFLVYGKPGTGKTTLAKVIARELKRNIILFNLKEIKNLRRLQQNVLCGKNGIIIFEELDCLIERIQNREKKTKGDGKEPALNDIYGWPQMVPAGAMEDDLELLDFLEILDGMRTTEDTILFFTTNHISKIDSAFRRQGRIDYLIEMKLCNGYQLRQMYRRILGREPPGELVEGFAEYKYSPANVIDTILKNIPEIRNGTIDGAGLLELIERNHENFLIADSSDSENNADGWMDPAAVCGPGAWDAELAEFDGVPKELETGWSP